jgi:ABC-type phosphate transport system permease subunit
MMIIHTAVFIESQTSGAAEEAGAAIGGTVLVILAFVVGLPLGIVFYLLSRKFDIDD